MSIYIHIPFCDNICSYCDFCKVFYNSKLVDDYLCSLSNEVDKYYKGEVINTIYVGGGTPSSLSLEQLNVLFSIIKKFKLSDNYEFTFECNIENINYDKLKMVKFNLDRNNTLLFRQKNERPRHIRYVNKILKNVKITDKNITTHIFRHTFITLMIQNGIKPRLVAEHVGHSSTKMIDQVYAHFTKEMDNELKNAIQSLGII